MKIAALAAVLPAVCAVLLFSVSCPSRAAAAADHERFTLAKVLPAIIWTYWRNTPKLRVSAIKSGSTDSKVTQ